ncbi:hypothetical protein HK103_005432 [Boothiomyces macroporosus]|uniref:DUF2421 domain-containing protein n=1 Tax=Boothiomyces macroporosus TaxID=261099 RepID=A0AAD5Y884_9FUNG|nr:hypothetical protein HK103_005432 [Boothiomyces macroporosus]
MQKVVDYLKSPLFRDTTKGVMGFLLSHAFLWIPDFRSIFPRTVSPSIYNYVCIAAIVLHGGKTVGNYWDGLVLLAVSIVFGGAAGALLPLVSYSSYVGLEALAFLFYFLFAYMKTVGPRFVGFAIVACLLVSISLMGTAGPPIPTWVPPPSLYYTIVSLLIGSLITLFINSFVFPTNAHWEMRKYISGWCSDLAIFHDLLIKMFVGDITDVQKSELFTTQQRIRGYLTRADMLINDLNSECHYSSFTPKLLTDACQKLKGLTQQCFVANTLVSNFRLWVDKDLDGVIPFIEDEKQDVISISAAFGKITDAIQSLLNGKIKPLDSDIERTKKCDQQDDDLILAICKFEVHQRKMLDALYKRQIQSQKEEVDLEWSKEAENLLFVHAFNLALEEIATKLIEVKQLLAFRNARRSFYFPFMKWVPFKFAAYYIRIFSPSTYAIKGRFSFGKLVKTFWEFMKTTNSIFAFKAATALITFLAIYLAEGSRSFFIQYGLGGSIITVVVVLSPTLGATYFSAILQLLGAISGNLMGMVTYYIMGPNWYLLWISVLLVGYPGYHILISMPQFTSLGLLWLISYSTTSVSCWNQQFLPTTTAYGVIFGRAAAATTMGVGFGVFFNLFVVPRFARDEMKLKIAKNIKLLDHLYLHIMQIPLVGVEKYKRYKSGIAKEQFIEELSTMAKIITKVEEDMNSIQLDIFEMRTLSVLCALEPSVGHVYDKPRYDLIIDSMEKMLVSLRSAKNTLKEAWYIQPQIIDVWDTIKEQRESLMAVIDVLMVLYAGAFGVREIPKNIPSAVETRAKLSHSLMSIHISRSVSENTHLEFDDDNDAKSEWKKVRKSLHDEEREAVESRERLYGVGSTHDVLYYTFVVSLRAVSYEVDKVGKIIQEMYPQEDELNVVQIQ